MVKPAGFYTKDKKVRPIMSAKQTSITDFISKVENQTRKALLGQQPAVRTTPEKLKTSLPVIESIGGLYNRKGIHPVFQQYIKDNYPAEKWVDRGYRIVAIAERPEHHFFGKGPRPIGKIYKVWEGDKEYRFELGNLQEWLAKHGISWYDYMHWQGHPRKQHLKEQILKAAVEEETKFAENKDKIKLVKIKDGYRVEDRKTAEELFVEDVEAGNIKDDKGLKLSRHQVYGQVPEGGYLNRIGAGLIGALSGKDVSSNLDKMQKAQKDLGYYSGLVIKITGDFDKDLRDEHNTWAVITKIIDNYHYEVKQEDYDEAPGKKLLIRDTDVKGWIGDLKTDFIGIGEKRHAEEVVPFIKKIMKQEGMKN